MYMRRVEAVLRKGWETHVDGQKLKADGYSFKLKLNTQELFDDWSRKVGRIERVEARRKARLRDQLGTAKNANEMLRIFSRFNALFIRPHIRGAIREYQTQLIQRVKDDIESLQEKFKAQLFKAKAFV